MRWGDTKHQPAHSLVTDKDFDSSKQSFDEIFIVVVDVVVIVFVDDNNGEIVCEGAILSCTNFLQDPVAGKR